MKTGEGPQISRGNIIRLILGLVIFAAASGLALRGNISGVEEYLLRLANDLPSFLSPFFTLVMQTGSLYFVPVAAGTALLYKHRHLAIKIGLGGVTVWLLAKL